MQVEEDLKYMNDYIEDTENVHNKLVDLKHRSRRNNMKIKKGWEEYERRVNSMLKERLDIKNVELKRAH